MIIGGGPIRPFSELEGLYLDNEQEIHTSFKKYGANDYIHNSKMVFILH